MSALYSSEEEETRGAHGDPDDGALREIARKLGDVLSTFPDDDAAWRDACRSVAPVLSNATRAAWPSDDVPAVNAARDALDAWAVTSIATVCLGCQDACLHRWAREFFSTFRRVLRGVEPTGSVFAPMFVRAPPTCPFPCGAPASSTVTRPPPDPTERSEAVPLHGRALRSGWVFETQSHRRNDTITASQFALMSAVDRVIYRHLPAAHDGSAMDPPRSERLCSVSGVPVILPVIFMDGAAVQVRTRR
jgi:hypothetical protein